MNPFGILSRPDSRWYFAGLASSFPDVGAMEGALSQMRPCDGGFKPGCRAFVVPDPGEMTSLEGLEEADLDEASAPDADLKRQVLIFRRKDRFHAIDHQCPHSSYPLSRGAPFDIEDFGIVLSSGITCPKHEWSFDLFTGTGDRGTYKLKIWEVQLRDIDHIVIGSRKENANMAVEAADREVWVRRKPRVG